MLRVSSFERYDLTNTPGDAKPAFTIWFAGCSLGCHGCQNPKLQDPENGALYEPWRVTELITQTQVVYDLDTVVLLGGEPMEQNHTDLEELCAMLNQNGLKIWLYTGWEFNEVPYDIRRYLHTMKTGRYDETQQTGGFPASANQRLFRNINNTWERLQLGGTP